MADNGKEGIEEKIMGEHAEIEEHIVPFDSIQSITITNEPMNQDEDQNTIIPVTLVEEEDLDDDELDLMLEAAPNHSTASLHYRSRENMSIRAEEEEGMLPRCSICSEVGSDTSSEFECRPSTSVVEADIEYDIASKLHHETISSTEEIINEETGKAEFRDILSSADVQVMFQAMKRNTALCAKHVHVAAGYTADNVQVMLKSVKTNTSICAKHVHDVAEDAAENMQVMFRTMKENTATAAKQVSEAAGEHAQKVGRRIIEVGKHGWYVLSHPELPEWMKDNEFLFHAHRPELASFRGCFREYLQNSYRNWQYMDTSDWFHCFYLCHVLHLPQTDHRVQPLPVNWQDKVVFGSFFAGAILCLGFSWIFHAVCCHSPRVSRVFSRLDYTGIALLIIGSFVPAVYYGFYCQRLCKIIYLTCVAVLGVSTIILSLWAKFSTPKYRPLRAGTFIALGCSGIVPGLHFLISMGLTRASQQASLGWMALMGLLYIIGALMYATRVPERFFPKKCNIWFQSHQFFHVFVVAAAFVHHHGICQMAAYRVSIGSSCD